MEIIRLTRNYYLKKKRFFGGYFCNRDFSYSPEFKTYVKATSEHLMELDIKTV